MNNALFPITSSIMINSAIIIAIVVFDVSGAALFYLIAGMLLINAAVLVVLFALMRYHGNRKDR